MLFAGQSHVPYRQQLIGPVIPLHIIEEAVQSSKPTSYRSSLSKSHSNNGYIFVTQAYYFCSSEMDPCS